ncbi:MAG: transglutaminase family protein [Planctomycetota bacterium]
MVVKHQRSGLTSVDATAAASSDGSVERVSNKNRARLEPRTLDELLDLSTEELKQVDIARMNLLCAKGLPGAPDQDSIEQALEMIDRWTERVRFETDRHLYRVHDPRYVERWNRSEARFRAETMLQVLQQDCGVHYNRDRIFEIDFSRSQDLFIHGLLPDDEGKINGGTCASMPVLYAAVGRRLGYPIYLVTASNHVFCRWDGKQADEPRFRETFNIEGTGEGGMAFHTDDYYKQFPRPLSDLDRLQYHHLETKSAHQELAMFLACRGHCLVDNRRLGEAIAAFEQSDKLHPGCSLYREFARQAMAMNGTLPRGTSARADTVRQILDRQDRAVREAFQRSQRMTPEQRLNRLHHALNRRHPMPTHPHQQPGYTGPNPHHQHHPHQPPH